MLVVLLSSLHALVTWLHYENMSHYTAMWELNSEPQTHTGVCVCGCVGVCVCALRSLVCELFTPSDPFCPFSFLCPSPQCVIFASSWPLALLNSAFFNFIWIFATPLSAAHEGSARLGRDVPAGALQSAGANSFLPDPGAQRCSPEFLLRPEGQTRHSHAAGEQLRSGHAVVQQLWAGDGRPVSETGMFAPALGAAYASSLDTDLKCHVLTLDSVKIAMCCIYVCNTWLSFCSKLLQWISSFMFSARSLFLGSNRFSSRVLVYLAWCCQYVSSWRWHV